MNGYFCFKMKFKDEDNQVVFCRVRKDANKTRLYIHEVYDLNKIKSTSLQTAAQEKPELGRGNALYTSILAQFFNADNTLSIQTLENGEPNFAQLDEKEFHMQRNAQKVDVYSANFKAWFGDWKKGTFKEIKGHSGNEDVLSVIPHIQKLLDTSVLLYTNNSNANRVKKMASHIKEYRTYGNKMKVCANEYYVKVIVRLEDTGVLVLHDIDLNKKQRSNLKAPDQTNTNRHWNLKIQPLLLKVYHGG